MSQPAENMQPISHLDPGIDKFNKVLVIGGLDLKNTHLKKILEESFYQINNVKNEYAINGIFSEYQPDIVIINDILPDEKMIENLVELNELSMAQYIPLIYITSSDFEEWEKYYDLGIDEIIKKPIDEKKFVAKLKSIMRHKEYCDGIFYKNLSLSEIFEQQNKELLGAKYQEKDLIDARSIIDRMHFPRFVDPGNIKWIYEAQNILSGDILCSAINPSGDHVVLVGDNTGHGLPAAISSIVTSETFYSMVSKGFDMQLIIQEINNKLSSFLPIDRFLAASIVSVNVDYKEIQVWNAGFPDIIIMNAEGTVKERVSSMDMALGIRNISESDIVPVRVDISDGDVVYAFSDGLFEVFDKNMQMYGEDRLIASIKSNFNKKNRIKKIVDDSMQFQESFDLNDDLLLLELTCNEQLLKDEKNKGSKKDIKVKPMPWSTKFEFSTEVIQKSNPIAMITQSMNEIQGFGTHRENIFLLLSEIYSNVLEHGLLDLDSKLKKSADGFIKYYELRQVRMNELKDAKISIDVDHVSEKEKGILIITMEHNGKEFDYENYSLNSLDENKDKSGRGLALINDLCRKHEYSKEGRKIKVEYEW